MGDLIELLILKDTEGFISIFGLPVRTQKQAQP